MIRQRLSAARVACGTIRCVALTVITGLVVALAATFVSLALFVRTAFGRVPHAITFLPVPLVLFNVWMTAEFVFETLSQFALTAMTPATAMRVVAFVFLVASLALVGFLYGCVSVVHQLLGGPLARRVRRGAKHLSLLFGALLIVGWSAYQFQASTALFNPLRRILGVAQFPVVLAAWIWLLVGARSLDDQPWRSAVQRLARTYVALFSLTFALAAVRDQLRAVGPALPLVVDIGALLAYTLLTVVWVESAQRAGRRAAAHQAMP